MKLVLVEVAPVTVTEENRAKQLNVARWVAAERVDFLYGEALRAWRASMGTQPTVRQVIPAGQRAVTTIVKRESQGDPKYLAAAQRYASAAGKIGVESWTLGGYSAEVDPKAEVREGGEPAGAAKAVVESGYATPPRSAPEPIRLQTAPVQPHDPPPLPSKKLTPRDLQARRDFLQAS